MKTEQPRCIICGRYIDLQTAQSVLESDPERTEWYCEQHREDYNPTDDSTEEPL